MTKHILEQQITKLANDLATNIVESMRDATLEDLRKILEPNLKPQPARRGRPPKGLRTSLAEALDPAVIEPPVEAPGESFSSDQSNTPPDLTLLSARELQVFNAIVRQKGTVKISQDLNLSPKTVSTYKRRIFQKMNLENDAQLILYAARHGIV